MLREESLYPADWLRIAEKDLKREDHRFYLVERYPFVVEASLTEDDVRDSLGQISGLIEKLRAEVCG